jgi:hypothetical protein
VPELIGEQPKPRLLIVEAGEVEDGEVEFHEAITRLVPTARVIAEGDLDQIRQKDWDAAVVFGSTSLLEDHLYVIQFGGTYGGGIHSSELQRPDLILTIAPLSRATQFEIPDNVPDTVRPLIRSSLVKLLESRSPNAVMRAALRNNAYNYVPQVEGPFICDGDGNVLAGAFVRPDGLARWWWVPGGIEAPERWVAAALADWTSLDAERFPAPPQWQDREEWQTPAEVDLASKIQAMRDKYKAVLDGLAQEELNLGTELERTVVEANATVRRLLTAQGDELVDEVQAAFEELGFIVKNVDKEITNPGDRREDLRVSDPDRAGWIAIVEVRGYRRGAQVNDLLRIGRFVTRYVQETSELPDSAWYVVNHFSEQDPATRPVPLAANPLELETFGADNGLVLDTRLLFQLRIKVRGGDIQADAARAQLVAARGLFEQ